MKNTNLPTANQTTRAEQITSSTEFVRTTIETTPATERETQGTAQQTPEPTSQLEKSTVKPQTTSEPINSTERKSQTILVDLNTMMKLLISINLHCHMSR